MLKYPSILKEYVHLAKQIALIFGNILLDTFVGREIEQCEVDTIPIYTSEQTSTAYELAEMISLLNRCYSSVHSLSVGLLISSCSISTAQKKYTLSGTTLQN